MARKTKAELVAEREAFLAAQEAEARATYPTRLMSALERLNRLGGEVRVKNGMFQIKTLKDDNITLSLEYKEKSERELIHLEYILDYDEAELAEANRMALLRVEALSMLSPDHLKALGL